jgi:hypothetical protein
MKLLYESITIIFYKNVAVYMVKGGDGLTIIYNPHRYTI